MTYKPNRIAKLHAYVAGPMTWRPAFNFPAFIEADETLNGLGITRTFNPAVHELAEGIVDIDHLMTLTGDPQELAHMEFDKSAALKRDMNAIADAEAIVLLPEWETSSGARLECLAAIWAGKHLLTLENGQLNQWDAEDLQSILAENM